MENEEIKNGCNCRESDCKTDKCDNKEKKCDKEKHGKPYKVLLEENERLIKENEELRKESAQHKDSWVRTAADFDNFRKRNQETRMTAYKDGKNDAISKILVIGDNLDRALAMDLDAKTKEGVEMTARCFRETLEAEGVTAIDPTGEKFNPETSEAVMKVPAKEGEEEGIVTQVFRKGYKSGDKIIRYAQVVVIG